MSEEEKRIALCERHFWDERLGGWCPSCDRDTQLEDATARVAELENALLTVKRWLDTGQFDHEACRTWIIDHLGEARSR